MPLSLSKKGGGKKKRSFNQAVGDFVREGMSREKALKIVGSIENQQYPKKKKRKRF